MERCSGQVKDRERGRKGGRKGEMGEGGGGRKGEEQTKGGKEGGGESIPFCQ